MTKKQIMADQTATVMSRIMAGVLVSLLGSPNQKETIAVSVTTTQSKVVRRSMAVKRSSLWLMTASQSCSEKAASKSSNFACANEDDNAAAATTTDDDDDGDGDGETIAHHNEGLGRHATLTQKYFVFGGIHRLISTIMPVVIRNLRWCRSLLLESMLADDVDDIGIYDE